MISTKEFNFRSVPENEMMIKMSEYIKVYIFHIFINKIIEHIVLRLIVISFSHELSIPNHEILINISTQILLTAERHEIRDF